MNNYTREQLLVLAKLTAEDLEEIERRRRDHNRLGFAYQLAFMRVYNRFPIQRPSFEIDHELLTFVGVQLDISVDEIEHYHPRQPTLSRHQEQIRAYLGCVVTFAPKHTLCAGLKAITRGSNRPEKSKKSAGAGESRF